MHRRQFFSQCNRVAASAALTGVGAGWLTLEQRLAAVEPGDRPPRDAAVRVLNPRARVPLSFIIDDSTCLVNLNKFAIPQFARAWESANGNGGNNRYNLPWQEMPDEIPDDFVREFSDWCGEQQVKGKYSIVPFPACVGRLDRVIPGWTDRQLRDSVQLVHDRMLSNWDIHPEMVTHTWVIDLKTGHPHPEKSPAYMENWDWSVGRSVDELASYSAYGLQILKNIGLPCEGITTPGGYGNKVLPELSKAAQESVRSVFGAEIPHYFRHLYTDAGASVQPRVEYASGLDSDDPQCVVSIIGCTGDWTGGWDCSNRGDLDRFITPDLASGRLVDVIESGEPACLVCHWTGIYFNGEKVGFKIFQEVVRRLNQRYDHLLWMKNSELARYWAARELTGIARDGAQLTLRAPYACPDFTIELPLAPSPPGLAARGQAGTPLKRVSSLRQLVAGSYFDDDDRRVVCFDLVKGAQVIS